MNKTEALELIEEKSIHGRELLTQYDVIDPTEPLHFNYIAKAALFDLNATLTGPERYAIQRLASNGNRKSARFELRLTPDQLTRLKEMAQAAAQSTSAYVVAQLFGGDTSGTA